MTLAFYAPLKPADHPVASGDRAMARGLCAALTHAGFDVAQTSRLQSRDGTGDAATQARLIAEAEAETPALIDRGRAEGWRGWLTYHNYYKAPDLLGPAVSRALGIPYLQVESTRARKRLTGPWADFAARAEAAADAADVIFYVTARDGAALHRDAPKGQHLIHLRPFLARTTLPPASPLTGPILSVGMMRTGDKLGSYRLIAETLVQLPPPWTLEIAGDGPARAEVAALMAPLPGTVRFLGELDAAALEAAYARAGMLFWPGVNEAFGLAYLEAQAAGLPVVAQDRPGVRDVLSGGPHPKPAGGPAALAARLSHLLTTPEARAREGTAARAQVAARHLLPAAAATLRDGLTAAGVTELTP